MARSTASVRDDRHPVDGKVPASTTIRPEIQALRAVAVLLVVAFHFWPTWVPGGFVGVDVFFVVSGFLITSHLLRDGARTGRIRLGAFWLRRALRLLPASYVVTLVTVVATLLLVPKVWWQQYFTQAIGSSLYVQNWVLHAQSTDYLTATDPPTAFQHFWSLSVEEQFYLVLPVIVSLCLLAAGRSWRRVALTVLVIAVGTSFIWSVVLTSSDPAAAYFVTTTRAWEFGAGTLLAFARPQWLRRLPSAAAWLGMALIAYAGFAYSAATPFPGHAALVPVLGAVLVLAVTTKDRFYAFAVERRPVQAVGDASYSIYLWHWPLAVLLPYALGHRLAPASSVAVALASLVVGWLSMRWIEQPFRLGRGRSTPRRSAIVLIIGSLLLIVTVSAIALRQIDAGADEVTRPRSIPVECWGAPALGNADCAPPQFVAPSAVNLAAHNAMENYDECFNGPTEDAKAWCAFGRRTSPTRLLAVGDSHMAVLAPVLEHAASARDWRVDMSTKGGCWPVILPDDFGHTGPRKIPEYQQQSCIDWIRWVNSRIETGNYDAVLMTHRQDLLVQGDGDAERATRNSVVALRAEMKWINKLGTKVITIQDVPRNSVEANRCMSDTEEVPRLTRCQMSQEWAYGRRDLDSEAAVGLDRVEHVRVSDMFCVAGRCPMVIGSLRVYLNDSHLNEVFSRTAAPEYTARISAALDAS